MARYPELGGNFPAIHDNLCEIDGRQERLLEIRLFHLTEWADEAVRQGAEGRDTLLQLLDALHIDREPPLSPDIPEENRDALRTYYRYNAASERLALLRTVIARGGQELLGDPTAESFEVSERAAGKVAYVQNSFSDNAYLKFSAALPRRPRAAYFDSFSDVCEEVYNGICEYGILPILHERDGKLFRFYSLLEKYDLRIVLACDVPGAKRDGEAVTRYALIRKTLPMHRLSGPCYIDLLLPTGQGESGGELCDLLQVARACGLAPARLDTRPSPDSEEMTHQVTLVGTPAEDDLIAALAYLTLCLPRCTVLGVYRVSPALM